MPRYRDVLKRTWRSNRDFHCRNFARSFLIALVSGAIFSWYVNRADLQSSEVWWDFARQVGVCFIVFAFSDLRVLYRELAARSLETLEDVASTYYPRSGKATWEQIVVCWSLLHADEGLREVFVGISQELECAPTLEHWKAAKFLAAF